MIFEVWEELPIETFMMAYFKIESVGTDGKERIVAGENKITGKGADPTQPQILFTTMREVANDHPWLHQTKALTMSVSFNKGGLA